MQTYLNTHHEQISALCRTYGVRRLEVFGSASESGRFDTTRSEVDLLVEFDQSPNGSYTDQYFGLLEDLSALLHRPVDLVVERAVRNPFFLESLRATRQVLYQAHAV